MKSTPEDIRLFSKIRGAKFIQPDGFEMIFAHGFFDFKLADYPGKYIGNSKEDPRNGESKANIYYSELFAIIKQRGGNPLFFTQDQVQTLSATPNPIPTTDAEGRKIADLGKTEQEIQVQDGALSQTKHREMGELNKGVINADPNASTLDHNLVKGVGSFNKGEGGGKAEAIRAAAIARNSQSAPSNS